MAVLIVVAGCEKHGLPTQPGSHTYTLSAVGSGTGSGMVHSVPAGISCAIASATASGACSKDYDPGTRVTLTETPGSGSAFATWGGACSGAGSCQLTMSEARSVMATFDLLPSQFALMITAAGRGGGTVRSSPAGISCGAACTAPFDSATVVTLTATPGPGSLFGGWTGACTGTGSCQVTMSQARSVTATWNVVQFALTVTPAGAGAGSVTSSPDGLACGSACSVPFDTGTVVTLTATPATGSVFAGWSGACTGTGSCQVTMSQARSVTATWNVKLFALTVSVAGSGAGSVTTGAGGFACGTGCSVLFDSGTVVTMTAAPATGSVFAGWSGACTGSGSCQVAMSQARAVTATFNTAPPSQFALAIAREGTGGGSVGSTPAGIACGVGTTCSAAFDSGTVVALTATPVIGSVFAGWSGACTGTGGCQVTMSRARSVTATFNAAPPAQFALVLDEPGTGNGTISWAVNGVACGAEGGAGCGPTFDSAAVVTLTAMPGTGSVFAGWGGACSGTGPCQVTMSRARSVTAYFNTAYYSFTVRGGGSGSGSVTSSPSGINCTFIHGVAGSGCTGVFPYGATISLNPVASDGNNFAGWGGVCTGTQACQVSVPKDTSVTVGFTLLAPATPIGLVVGSRSASSLVISWRRSSEADLYYLMRSPTSGGAYLTVYSGRDTVVTDAGLASGTTYYYVVRSWNNVGWSSFSGELAATTLPGVPSVPTGLLVGSPTASSLQISWGLSPQATGYQLLRSASATGTYTQVYTGTGTSVTDPGLTAGTTYYYEVKASNAYGSSDPSAYASGTTLAGPPPAVPTGLVVGDPTASSLRISWSASAHATGYQLLRSSSAFGTYSQVYSGTATSITDPGLAAGTTYYYKVQASNAYGSSDPSAYASGTTLAAIRYETAYLKAVFGRGGFTWTTNVAKWQSGTIWIRYSDLMGHHIASPSWSRCYDAVLVLDPHDHDDDGHGGSASDQGRGDDDRHGGSASDHDRRDDDDAPSFFFSEHAPRSGMGLDIDPATTSVTVEITGVLERHERHESEGRFWTRTGAWGGRFDFDSPSADCQTLTRTIPVEALAAGAPFRIDIGFSHLDGRFRDWGAGIREVTLTFNGWLVPVGLNATVWRCTGLFNGDRDRDHAYPRGDRDRSCELGR